MASRHAAIDEIDDHYRLLTCVLFGEKYQKHAQADRGCFHGALDASRASQRRNASPARHIYDAFFRHFFHGISSYLPLVISYYTRSYQITSRAGIITIPGRRRYITSRKYPLADEYKLATYVTCSTYVNLQ